MNPIPLTSPDGRVFAYACGTCLHVAHAGSMLQPLDADDLAELAEDARAHAETCCTCQRCSKPWPRSFRCVCETCEAKDAADAPVRASDALDDLFDEDPLVDGLRAERNELRTLAELAMRVGLEECERLRERWSDAQAERGHLVLEIRRLRGALNDRDQLYAELRATRAVVERIANERDVAREALQRLTAHVLGCATCGLRVCNEGHALTRTSAVDSDASGGRTS